MSIDWDGIRSRARERDSQQYASMKAGTEKRKAAEAKTPDRKIIQLENQRRQAQVDLDTDAIMSIDKQLKELRRQTGKQTLGDRADDAFSGAVKGTAGGFTNAAGLAVNLFQDADNNERQVQRLRKVLETGRTSDGKTINTAQRAAIQKAIGDLSKQARDWRGPDSAVSRLYGAADRMQEESAQDIQRAKEGLGKAGQLAVDVGVAGSQLAGDLGASLLIPGAGVASRLVRGFGSGAQEARQAGASLGQQMAYGAASSAVGLATEKLSNIAAPFKRAFGSGVLDKAVAKAAGKLWQSAAGKTVLSALGEGSEEVLEGLMQPILQRTTYDPEALAHYKDPDYWADALYDGLVGAALGGIGGAVSPSTYARNGRGGAADSPGAPTAGGEGRATPQAQKGPQGVPEGVMDREVQRLYAKENPPAQGAGYAGTKVTSPDNPLGVSATQEDASSIAPLAENASKHVDPLLDAILGGKRVDQTTLTNEQFGALADRGDIGMDASGRVYQVDPTQHIDQRTENSVGSRKLNAFQFDHPELQPYYKKVAEELMKEAMFAVPGGRTESATGEYGQTYSWRTKREASSRISYLLDDCHMSYARIENALDAILHDKGQENYADAKRVELVLDDMLTHGYNDGTRIVPADDAYLRAKEEIAGSQAGVERESPIPEELYPSPGDDGLGAADAGSLNSDYDRLQAQSDTFHPEGPYAARPVDVPTTDFDGRNVPKSSSTVMGAQGTTVQGVQLLEQQIADGTLSFDTITDQASVSRAQSAIQQKGFDGALEQYRQAASQGVATKDNTTLGQQLLLQAMREGNESATAELLALYTRNSTTAAQAMQAQSILRKLSPEGQLVAVQKAVDALNEKYGTGVELDPADVADFLNAKTDDARREAQQRMVEKAAQAVPGTFRAKYDTLRYLAMLGNPRTHIRNILGNAFFQVPVAVKNRVGAVAEAAASAVSGGKVERTKSLFGANPLGKLAAEARADWANVKDFLGQSSKYMDGQTSLWDIEREADAFSNDHLLGRGVNKLADLNSRALEAEDTAAKYWIYTQSLAGYLKANGCKSLSDADPALLNRARTYAAQEALRNTFNDRNQVSDAVSRLGGLSRSDNKVEQAAGYVVEGVLPFKKTPANIAVRAVEYSPIGAVIGAVQTLRGARAGDTDRVSAGLDRVAAGVSGTALLAAGFLLAGQGAVTGGEDEDREQAAFNDLTGHQNYALELRDGTSVTLDWLAPEAIPFFMGVEMNRAMQDGGLSWDEAWSTVKNITEPMLEMSMLQGLNDTFENAAYAHNRGGSVMGSVITSALTNYATQIFPTIGGQIERSGEDRRMTTYTDKNSDVPSDLQYAMGRVSQKIPGWDYQQLPYIDAWGREEETGDALERSINSLFNPAYISQVDVDQVEQELQRVKDATGDSSVFPQRAARSITVDGERKDLTAEEYQRYAKALGSESYRLVREATGSEVYRRMGDGERAAYIGRLYQYADQTAKASVSGYEPETWAKNAQNAQRDLGVSPAEYIALYEQYGSSILSGSGYEKTKQAVEAGLTVGQYAAMRQGMDADGNGAVSQREAQGYLDRQDFSRDQKADLFSIINKSWKKNPYQ